jgi:1,4-dihydroxy-2-naphthoyl-CoA synthase
MNLTDDGMVGQQVLQATRLAHMTEKLQKVEMHSWKT